MGVGIDGKPEQWRPIRRAGELARPQVYQVAAGTQPAARLDLVQPAAHGPLLRLAVSGVVRGVAISLLVEEARRAQEAG